MGGVNPYIEPSETPLPAAKYRVVFRVEGTEATIDVDPENLPPSGDGLAGSLLSLALSNGVEIDHACGGVCACSTCHVHVIEGLETCNESAEAEEDMLDSARDVRMASRLACQCVPNGESDIVVEVPGWNRNLAREEH